MAFFPYGRGDLGRAPAYTQTDLFVEQHIRLTGRTRVSLGVNVANLFDQQTETAYVVTPYRDNFNLPDAQFFGGFDPAAIDRTCASAPTRGIASPAASRIGGRSGCRRSSASSRPRDLTTWDARSGERPR